MSCDERAWEREGALAQGTGDWMVNGGEWW